MDAVAATDVVSPQHAAAAFRLTAAAAASNSGVSNSCGTDQERQLSVVTACMVHIFGVEPVARALILTGNHDLAVLDQELWCTLVVLLYCATFSVKGSKIMPEGGARSRVNAREANARKGSVSAQKKLTSSELTQGMP
eukprot:14152-Heterococcus_DN1.PRE.5